MEIRQLRSFCKIVELGSFSRAAGSLRLTQPALGLQIKNLEEELGAALLIRHSRGVAVTPRGAILLGHAQSILAGVQAAHNAVRQTMPSMVVRLGMAPSLATMLTQPLKQRSKASNAGIRLDLSAAPTRYLNDWVSDGSIDLAIACEGPVPPNVRREEVLREALYLVQSAAPGEPAIGQPVAFADLTEMPLLVADPLLTRMMVDKLQSEAAIAGISLHIHSVLPSTSLVKDAVEDGEGVTVLPYAVVRRECEQRRLRVRQIVGPALTRSAYLLSHVSRPQANDVSQLIRDVIGEQICSVPEHGEVVQATC